MHALSYHTFTHLPRFFIQGNITHSPSTRLFFHDCGIGIKKTTMARRNFIKAYNDMVSGSGQPNVGGLNFSEMANNGPFHREVDAVSRQSSLKINKEKAYPPVVNSPKPSCEYKPPPSTRSVQAGVRLGCIKQKDRNLFVDIDGEALPSEELNDKGVEVIDTSHKIQRHISLVDLARPYVPRVPANSAKVVQENREKKEMVKSYEPVKTKTLPKGISGSDKPYVLPKFTPNFKEMLSTRSKNDTLVSITESTPPSMQKWAIEWNSEPKHSISIAELKEDIMREKYERAAPGTGNNKDIIYGEEEPLPSKDAKRRENDEPTTPKSMDRTLNTLKPRGKTGYHYSNHSESIDTIFEPTQYEQQLKQMEAEAPANYVGSNPSLDWLPEKYENMKRVFKGIREEQYSFKEAIREKVNNDRQQKLSNQNKVSSLQGTTDVEFSFDEDRRKFHQWFRSRLTRADKDDVNGTKNAFVGIDQSCNSPFYATGHPYITSDKKLRLESITYSGGDPTRTQLNEKPRHQNIRNENIGTDQFAKISSNIPDYLPPKDEVKEQLAEQYPSEKNSSFYYWLRQRGLINVMKGRTSEKRKPARIDDEAVTPEPKFPWSTSYMCKYVPGNSATRKERKGSKPAGIKSSRDTISLRKAVTQSNISKERAVRKKVKSQGSFEKTEAKKTSFVKKQGKSRAMKNRLGDDDGNESRRDGQSGRIPYYGWVVGNELDHVKSLRFMENNHVAPQVMNRKKLFPSLHEQISIPSLNYLETKYTTPSKTSNTDDSYSKRKVADLGGVAEFDEAPGKNRTESRTTVNISKWSNIFEDKNFINISEDLTVPMKLLFNDPEEPTSLDTNIPSIADDDDRKISRCALKLSQKIDKKLAGGSPTLKAKLTETSEIHKRDPPIHSQFARNLDSKTDGIDTEDEFYVRGSKADGNGVDEDWIHMISPNGFRLDNDGDLIHFLKKSGSEFKPSFASPKLR